VPSRSANDNRGNAPVVAQAVPRGKRPSRGVSLHRTTRPLYLQVRRILDQLGLATVGSPTTASLIALYVTGLILLDARPTQT
jgi:hypothetical protein